MLFNFQNIIGFDISTWQDSPNIPGVVDFQKMRNYGEFGARFVIIKAGQGNWKDQDFDVNWKNSKGVLSRSSYWYYDNRYPPKQQAEKYFEIIKGDPEGVCWLDLEDRGDGLYKGWRNWHDFLERFKILYPGAKIGIYTNFYYFVEMMRGVALAEKEYFDQYPLWLASYPPDPFEPDYRNILVPFPWYESLILQSGTPDIGIETGVESEEIDYNQFNGDEATFYRWFKKVESTPQPPGEPGVPMDYVELRPSVAGEWRSIRQQTNYPTIPHVFGTTSTTSRILAGQLAKAGLLENYVYGEDVYVDGVLRAKKGDKWHNVYEANGQPASGWVAEIHLGKVYLTVREVHSTPVAHTVEVYIDGILEFRKELS